MKREAMIICPCSGNNGADLGEHIKWVRDAMVRAFGGAHATGPDWGAWEDDGAVQEERVIRITSAMPVTPDTEQTLQIIARTFGISAKQKCVYVRFPDGNVRLIETEHLWNRKAAYVSTPGGTDAKAFDVVA